MLTLNLKEQICHEFRKHTRDKLDTLDKPLTLNIPFQPASVFIFCQVIKEVFVEVHKFQSPASYQVSSADKKMLASYHSNIIEPHFTARYQVFKTFD